MAHACLVLVVVALAISQNWSAHGAPLDATTEYLDAHNKARSEVGVKPLKWSEKLANSASLLVRYQKNKMGCHFANLSAGKYGGNQEWTGGTKVVMPRKTVERWVEEKKYYNYGNNTCEANHKCGVYTQVVWRKSIELGCAQAVCVKERATLTICFYSPPGNFIERDLTKAKYSLWSPNGVMYL